MIAPACSMKRGKSRPSSSESTVPDTAPTANRTAVPRAQRRASSRWIARPVRRQATSAITMRSGIAMPMAANTMWNASE